jgi:hypothetical protein
MKKIFHLTTPSYISEWEFITETDYSVIGRSFEIEVAFSKKEEGIKWFWSREEAENAISENVAINKQIDELKKLLK